MTTTPHTNNQDHEVLVVGAGPVGLVAAGQLARQGVSVLVVDLLDAPTTEARAAAVHARSLEMLASLSVREELEAAGRPLRAMEIARGGEPEPQVSITFRDLPTRHSMLLDVAQADTEAVLARRATALGVETRRGATLTALDQDDDGVTVTLRTPNGTDTLRVGWVIGADGGHSTTRHLLGGHLEGSFHGQHFAMSDSDIDTTLDRDVLRMFLHPDGLGMLFPLAGDRARIMFIVDEPGPGELTLEQMQAIVGQRTGGQITLRDPRWLTYFEVHHAQVPQYRRGRVLLAGDAAHLHSPAGGQGMNTGIQDAANLAWKLALVLRHGADPGLLDTYHDERHPVGASVVRLTMRMTDIGTATGPTALLRELAYFIVGHIPSAARAAASHLAELAVHYRDSALSVQELRGPRDAARAGDRVPDPIGPHRPDGTPTAIEDLLAHPGLLLLARTDDHDTVTDLRETLGALGTVLPLSSEAPRRGDDHVLVDPRATLARMLGIDAGGMALVRPDGYIGLVADADSTTLHSYLTDALRVRGVVRASTTP